MFSAGNLLKNSFLLSLCKYTFLLIILTKTPNLIGGKVVHFCLTTYNFNKVFAGLAKSGKGTMGWCHGFKLHLLCNDSGEVMTFCLTGANVDDRDSRVWTVFAKVLYGKVFADRGYIKQELFENLFSQGVLDSFMVLKRR